MLNAVDTAARLGITPYALRSSRYRYEKRHGHNPPWFDSEKKLYDIDMIEAQNERYQQAYVEGQHLYYELKERGYSDSDIAAMLPGSANSWRVFMAVDLWTLRDQHPTIFDDTVKRRVFVFVETLKEI